MSTEQDQEQEQVQRVVVTNVEEDWNNYYTSRECPLHEEGDDEYPDSEATDHQDKVIVKWFNDPENHQMLPRMSKEQQKTYEMRLFSQPCEYCGGGGDPTLYTKTHLTAPQDCICANFFDPEAEADGPDYMGPREWCH